MIGIGRIGRTLCVIAAGLAASGAAAKAPPAELSPPPLPRLPMPPPAIPPRPLPPLGSVPEMIIPPLDAGGVRLSVNANLSPAQRTWHVQSAMNVAALNCLEPKYQPVLDAYKAMLKNNTGMLAKLNRTLDQEYRAKYGTSFRAVRDVHTTQVYNYFALPPTLPDFCNAALALANEVLLDPHADLNVFAVQALPRLEQVFETFFRAFDQYRLDAAAWDARYGLRVGTASPMPGAPATTPQPVAPPAKGP